MEYGRTEVERRRVAEWQSGTTIVLPQLHAEPVTIFVDDQLVALGELVEIEGKLGVRILDLVTRTKEASS